jgi:hypothetical protein
LLLLATGYFFFKHKNTLQAMLSIQYVDPNQFYKRVLRRKKHKRSVGYKLKNEQMQGMIFGGRVTKHCVDIDYLGKGELLERRRRNSVFQKYRLFFPCDEVFSTFVRVAYMLGEPFWMCVLGWIKGQKHSGNLEKMFWRLKKNTYLR